ncbi:ATP-grasp domain-containing protein [Nonomuraea sp. NPDC046570]|uniref:ATP-grasp domain-containing protein n=1 Tax=Nonomuraea sp. NPDC046570 TaxID=3155255 RepID=UPI0033DD30CD
MGKPLLVVVFDLGAVDPVKISFCARTLCDVIFVCDRSNPYVAKVVDRTADFADIVDITGLSQDEICRRVAALRPDGIVTFSEYQLALTAAIAAECGLPFHSPATVDRLVDKFQQRKALTAAGVQATRCVVVRSAAEAEAAAAEVGLPAVVKPRIGAGSVDTCRVDTTSECAAVVAEFLANTRTRGITELVVETMLVGDPAAAGAQWGDYVSVESVVNPERIQTVCVTGKFPLADPFRETGYFMPSALSEELIRAVVEVEQSALRALGVQHGITHTEVKLTPDGPKVIEVNGRLGGYVSDILQRAANYDLVRVAIQLALGQPVQVPPIRWRSVAYQYFLAPPVGVERLVELNGVDEVNEIPGVRYLELHVEPGQSVDWRNGTRAHLGIVYGSASDHEDLQATLAEIDRRFQPVYA